MDKREQIWVSVCAGETRAVRVEQGVIQEIQLQRGADDTLVGNIYSARVARVMPDLQAAFVEFGSERHGFLALADLERDRAKLKKDSASKGANIADFLYQGQKLRVQVIKDPVANKGARLSTQLSISSRYLAFSPESTGIGVSRSIAEAEERKRLRQVLLDIGRSDSLHGDMQGFIVRTAASGALVKDIEADFHFITSVWASILQRSKSVTGVSAIYTELPLALRILRDLVRHSTEQILIDCHETFLNLTSYCQSYIPDLVPKLKYHECGFSASDELAIELEIQQALSRRVELASGAYLIIDQTEAMTVVDVNSGASASVANRSSNLKDASFSINKEAASALARQLSVRNVGGIVVVDFIDMASKKQRRDLVSFLRDVTAADVAVGKISETSSLGLVEMTRKRSRQSLVQLLCADCSPCHGRGYIKSPTTVAFDILRKLRRIEQGKVVVIASPAVVDCIQSEQADELLYLQSIEGRQIDFRRSATVAPELFELAVS